MKSNISKTNLTTVIKAKHIDNTGQLQNDSYYWILPEELSAEVGDMAFVETNQGPQIVHITDVRKWGQKKINKFIQKIAEIHKREPEEMKKVIAVQTKPKS